MSKQDKTPEQKIVTNLVEMLNDNLAAKGVTPDNLVDSVANLVVALHKAEQRARIQADLLKTY